MHVSNTITQITKQCTLNKLYQQARFVQNTTIDSGSTSVVIKNLNQHMSITMVASLVSKVFSEKEVQDSIDYTNIVKNIQLETKFSDLLKELDETVDTIEDLLSTIIGKIIVTIATMLFIAIIVFAAVFFYRPKFVFQDWFSKIKKQKNSSAVTFQILVTLHGLSFLDSLEYILTLVASGDST